jgi:hypothetical protein
MLSSLRSSSLARLRPPLPAVIVAAAAIDGGGRAWQIFAAAARSFAVAPFSVRDHSRRRRRRRRR